MSIQHRVAAVCPNCGKVTESKIRGTVNIGLNPELREEVLTGRIRRATCPFCSSEFNVEWLFLYHDPTRQFIISYHPIIKDGRTAPIPTETLDVSEKVLCNYNLRLVTSWNHLREKIGIFEDGLDDYPIETIKSVIGGKIFGTPKFGDEALFYLCTRQSSSGESELVFQAFHGREHLADARFPLDMYRTVRQEVIKKFGRGWERGEWMTINQGGIGRGKR